MKKNLIMSLVVAGMMGLMLTGCGKGAPEKVTVEVEPTVEATTEVANPEEQPLIDEEPTVETAEPTTEEATDDTVEVVIEEEGTVVSDEQVEVGDYLSENGITITPQGSVTSMLVADYGADTTHERNVTITVETVPSDEEGYSDTIFEAVWDRTDNGTFSTHYSFYDRYTGTDLSITGNDVEFTSAGGTHRDVCVVEVDGVKYDCSYTFDWDTSAGTSYTGTIVVHHPSDYDGVVFSAGANTASLEAFEATLDPSASRKLTDYPQLIEGHLFFTATDN